MEIHKQEGFANSDPSALLVAVLVWQFFKHYPANQITLPTFILFPGVISMISFIICQILKRLETKVRMRPITGNQVLGRI